MANDNSEALLAERSEVQAEAKKLANLIEKNKGTMPPTLTAKLLVAADALSTRLRKHTLAVGGAAPSAKKSRNE